MLTYLVVMLTYLAHLPPETAWPWATGILEACKDAPAVECVRFTAQAVAEGGFHEHVLSGKCNDPAWRRRQRGSWWRDACDSGAAAGPWQVHGKDIGASPDALRDPAQGARLAWDYWRRAPLAWTTRAAALRIAEAWLTRFPLPPLW